MKVWKPAIIVLAALAMAAAPPAPANRPAENRSGLSKFFGGMRNPFGSQQKTQTKTTQKQLAQPRMKNGAIRDPNVRQATANMPGKSTGSRPSSGKRDGMAKPSGKPAAKNGKQPPRTISEYMAKERP